MRSFIIFISSNYRWVITQVKPIQGGIEKLLHLYYLRKWFWFLLVVSVTVDFVLGFDIIVTALQLLISFVRVREFIPYHQTTEACNVIEGATDIDYILSTISTAFMYIFLQPGVFIITSMIVPGVPSELHIYFPYLDRHQRDMLWKPVDFIVAIRQKIDSQSVPRVSQRSVVYSTATAKADLEDEPSKELYLKSEARKPRFEDYAVATNYYTSLSLSTLLSPVLQADRLVLWVCKKYFEYLYAELDHQTSEDELLVLAVARTSYNEDEAVIKKTFRRLCNKFYNPIKKMSDEALINEYLSQKAQAQVSLEGDIFALGDSISGLSSHEHYKAFPVFFNLCRCVKQQSSGRRSGKRTSSKKERISVQPSGKYAFTYIALCNWIEYDIKQFLMTFSTYRRLVETVPVIGLAADLVIKILSFSIGHVTTRVGLSAWILTVWKMVKSILAYLIIF